LPCRSGRKKLSAAETARSMYIVWIDRLRRWHRRLAKRKASGSLHSITVFVRYENVIRLLEFLGYQLE
jgi:hypothetical protein